MANTIRRTPVSFDIPDSPDYKFLNITDFRGIAISDNPFTLSSNTASDILNLYVDETNTLTTRPRLEKFVSLKKDHPNLTMFLGCYPLSFGFLVHYMDGINSYVINIAIEVNGELTYYDVNNGEVIKGKKLTVFEQNDSVYILDGNDYYVITYVLENKKLSNISCSLVEGYVPTVSVGGTNLINGSAYESLNLLSSMYKNTYFWDGTWNPGELKTSDLDEIENKYINRFVTQISVSSNNPITPYRILESSVSGISNTNDNLSGLRIITTNNQFELERYKFDVDDYYLEKEYTVPSAELPDNYSQLMGDASSDGETICMYYYYPNMAGPSDELACANGGAYVQRNNKWFTLKKADTVKCNINQQRWKNRYNIRMNDTGDIVAITYCEFDSNYNDWSQYVEVFKWSGSDYVSLYKYKTDNVGQYNQGTLPSTSKNYTIDLSRNGNTLVLERGDVSKYLVVTGLLTGSSFTPYEIEGEHVGNNFFKSLSYDGTLFLLKLGTSEVVSLYNIASASDISLLALSADAVAQLGSLSYGIFSEDNEKFYMVTRTPTSVTPDRGYVLFKEFNDAIFVSEDRGADMGNIAPLVSIATDNLLLYFYSGTNTLNYEKVFFDFENTEPLLTITKTLSNNDDEYTDWSIRRSLFKKALLTIRFNNNRWFGVKNTLFRTFNNDPTYISVDDYSDLGETDENITGFNLVQDDLLVAYKDNYIWAITPTTYSSGDITYYDYNYQETKNTIGNNAIGASIVSAYSELPLQITYDGIYALSQLSNVYASDRISESISDNIAKKWQKEDKNIIQKAQTLNRLYWTYVILSYEKITKVYLLDNRTTSWFYWELPVKVVNAFVKDNTVYFTNNEGNIYTLQTSEIINKYNPDTTEYYDDGEQIISWFWKSQILPLGTINHSKRLIDTTFIFTDTDATDEYSLDYKFTAYRKVVSQTNATTISNQLNYIQSTTKKTLINRCNFIQLELSNTVDDLNSNRLRLVGLGFKYVLLEGLL